MTETLDEQKGYDAFYAYEGNLFVALFDLELGGKPCKDFLRGWESAKNEHERFESF